MDKNPFTIRSDLLKPLGCEISIFLSFVAVLLCSFVLLLNESVRQSGALLCLRQAADAGIDSLFSQYHRDLWKRYRLLGLEHYSSDQLIQELRCFIQPSLSGDDWYYIDSLDISTDSPCLLTDGSGTVFEKEVIDYMRFGNAFQPEDEAGITAFADVFKEGLSVKDLSAFIKSTSRAADLYEATLTEIEAAAAHFSGALSSAASSCSAHDGEDALSALNEASGIAASIPSLTACSEQRAEDLKTALETARTEQQLAFSEGKITRGTLEALMSELASFENYIADTGPLRTAVRRLDDRADAAKQEIAATADTVLAALEAEEAEADASEDGDFGDGDFYSSLLWAEAAEQACSVDKLTFRDTPGVGNKNKKRAVESIRALLDADLLKLVLPDGTTVSDQVYATAGLPSKTCFFEKRTPEPVDRLLLCEYIARMTDHYGSARYEHLALQGTGGCEAEYVLYGKESDYDCLEAFAEEFALLRSGLNLLFLLKNTSRRSQARTLAVEIAGITGSPALIGMTEFVVLYAWAAGQAIEDTRRLLSGGKVPVMHTSATFRLNLTDLLKLARRQLPEPDGEDVGHPYCWYLKAFQFVHLDSFGEYRMLDVIQRSLGQSQSDFLINRCLYSLNASVSAQTRCLFLTPPGTLSDRTGLNVSTSKSY